MGFVSIGFAIVLLFIGWADWKWRTIWHIVTVPTGVLAILLAEQLPAHSVAKPHRTKSKRTKIQIRVQRVMDGHNSSRSRRFLSVVLKTDGVWINARVIDSILSTNADGTQDIVRVN